jgi:beta-carotene hydroxylase
LDDRAGDVCGADDPRKLALSVHHVIHPHDPKGETELTHTRLFRGRILSILALEHLYHLEHHLYPQVPHHNWPELARRLDPYFARVGLRPLRLFF